MNITIKDENNRFGVRVCAIIYNQDKTKIFMQKQEDKDFYMFPGGRLEINEETLPAIKRELKEELGIESDIYLKYIVESFIDFTNKFYHELGFYFITTIPKEKLSDGCNSNDRSEINSIFEWVDIDKLNEINILPNGIKEKIILKDTSKNIEHLVYKENL